jgi:Nucleotidyltransferase of unknown function (DUF6036)
VSCHAWVATAGVFVGGAALHLLGVITRKTKDCDVLDPLLPASIVKAARVFAAELRSAGEALTDDWLNNGPRSLVDALPVEWRSRLQRVFQATAMELQCLGRQDLLASKLFALCDRGIDLGDCVALAPNPEELSSIRPWLEFQDANPEWPEPVRATLADLGRRLGHGV